MPINLRLRIFLDPRRLRRGRRFTNVTIFLWLIVITLSINAALMFCPFLTDSDPTVYFIIAKHMALYGHWQNLYTNYGPWLDKPHFPFWITAIAFKLLGCHVWSYILPGFLFYVLGGIYTYQLAQLFYDNRAISLLSLLIYVTTLRLMLSSLDMRAEAYLLGTIMPACYYWLQYHEKATLRALLLGAFFTALAVMTKGIFVCVTIGSGLLILGIYQKRFKDFIQLKWWGALLLVFFLTLPELIALYHQFGSDGLRWFFIESQFGRFFESGRIVKHHGDPAFFIQVFIWAFLPWTVVAITAFIRNVKKNTAYIYLISSFFITFIVFSMTSFKMDYYTNIIFPFAAILSAHYLYECMQDDVSALIFKIQIGLSWTLAVFMIALISIVSIKVMPDFMWMNLLPIAFLIYVCINTHRVLAMKAIVYSVVMINVGLITLVLIQTMIVSIFNSTYQIARYINQHQSLPVYEYQMMTNLSVYLHEGLSRSVNNLREFPIKGPYYVVMDAHGPMDDIFKRWPHSYVLLKQEHINLTEFTKQVFLNRKNVQPDYRVLIKVA